jgi:predicted AlkP superfamily pyrophosphatase or phosphodiesterase
MGAARQDPTRQRLVVFIADGLRADVAEQAMGYLWARVEAGLATATRYTCALPSISRPLYATLLNGQVPVQHGIVTNDAVQACGPTLLHDAHAAGLRSVVVAYHWFYELLSGIAFNPLTDRRAVPAVARSDAGVVDAAWYFDDAYPDSHTVADAEDLRLRHNPDLMLIHPMGPDDTGHRHGGDSDAYRLCARRLDGLLAHALPGWHAAGYDVLLTSDHGMNRDHMHGGDEPTERMVPFVWLPHAQRPASDAAAVLALPLPTASTGLRPFVAAHRALLGA